MNDLQHLSFLRKNLPFLCYDPHTRVVWPQEGQRVLSFFVFRVKGWKVCDRAFVISGITNDNQTIEVWTYEKTKWNNILRAVDFEARLFSYGTIVRSSSGRLIAFSRMLDFYNKTYSVARVLIDWNPSKNNRLIAQAKVALGEISYTCPIKSALHHLFFPSSQKEFLQAQKEIAMAGVKYFFTKFSLWKETHLRAPSHFKKLYTTTPLNSSLKTEQEEAIQKIIEFLHSESRVFYLLGEVASGKSVILRELAARLINANSELQIFLISPTVLLAKQHFQKFIETYPQLEPFVAFSTGFEKHEPEGSRLWIGTHALFSGVRDADIVLIDEPQKFGLSQMFSLRSHHLVFATATPLPLWSYLIENDMIPSFRLREKYSTPRIVPLLYSESQLVHLLKKLPAEHKKIIIVPRIDAVGYKYANFEKIATLLKEMRIRFYSLHGNQSAEDNRRNLSDFIQDENGAVLLATRMIENGIDLPGIRYLIITGAETFGVLSLYQMIGRVGRGRTDGSFAYLLSENKQYLQKMASVKTSRDAYLMDLQDRGTGEIENKQSGFVDIPYSSLLSSSDLHAARNAIYKAEEMPLLSAFFT